MARARNIKPGFFRNAELVELSFEARLLFIGLWTIADRAGRLEDRPKQIKMELFPADNMDCDALLGDLAEIGMVERYEYEGVRYLQVVNFCKHQNPHKDEKASTIPDKNGNAASTNKAQDKHDASMVQAQCKDDGNPADSLIPDSLNLIPDLSISSANALDVRSDADEPADLVIESKKSISCPHQKVIDLYHQSLPYCPQVREWNTTRQRYLQSRWREKAVSLGWQKDAEGLEWFHRFFAFVAESKFLTGKADGRGGKPPFVADLEWLMKPSNFAKVVEGKYHQ